jgi:hypothetical protein
MSVEDRTLSRGPALKTIQIVHGNGAQYIDARIIDIHSKGARIACDRASILGSEIEFIIKPENVKVTAQVRWREDDVLGVEFNRKLGWMEKHDKPTSSRRAAKTPTFGRRHDDVTA